MRLLAGWLCLSLASVWLARRMWTLRSPLSRSLYVNMTSGPGGPAAAAGGGKDTHQVLGRGPAERGRGARPSRARPGHCAGRLARALAPASHKLFPARALAPLCLLFGGTGAGQPLLPGSPDPSVGAPEPRIVPRPSAVSVPGLRTRATLGWATQLALGPEQKTAPAITRPAFPLPREERTRKPVSFCLAESLDIQRVIKTFDWASRTFRLTFSRNTWKKCV